jgi:tetratricopeptide (TPR) repeat protein
MIMKKNILYLVFAFLVALPFGKAISQPSSSDIPELKTIDAQIDIFYKSLDVYPPQFADAAQKQKTETDLKSTLQKLNELAQKYPNNLKVETRLGECYRMAHNLDWKGAWEDSEKHLKKAIELKPDEPYPYLILGRLYVNTDPKLAPAAEKEFRKVLELGQGKAALEDAAHAGLFFSNYYQGKMKEAVAEADLYLKSHPDDSNIKTLRKVAAEKAQKGN